MTESEPPAPKPVSQLSSPPQQPAIADALRALGPDYEEALVNSIAERVDELAREREAKVGTAPHGSPRVQLSGGPLPIPAPAPAPVPVPMPGPEAHREHHEQHHPRHPGLPVSILSVIFGFVITVVALTAGLALGGPLALVAILIVWVALVLINLAIWVPQRA